MDDDTTQIEPEEKQEFQQKLNKKSIKISKKTIIIFGAIVAFIILVYFCKGFFIAATINGSPISRLDIIQKLEKASGQSLLESLIIEKLIKNEADSKKIIISNEEVDGEIKKIEDQVALQGSTIEAELASQGMGVEDLKTQIILQKKIEKLIVDKISVTDEEIAQYIKDNEVSVVKGQETTTNEEIKNELSNQKFNTEAQKLISDLKARAKIKYFVNY